MEETLEEEKINKKEKNDETIEDLNNENLSRFEIFSKLVKQNLDDIITCTQSTLTETLEKYLKMTKLTKKDRFFSALHLSRKAKLLFAPFENPEKSELTDEDYSRVTKDQYYANLEGKFEKYLFAVLLLKSMGIFNQKYRLCNVKLVGGGYKNGGKNIGITFNYNDVQFEFSENEVAPEVAKIPYTEKQIAIVELLNKCCNNSFEIYQ